jgi:hypothetical protein
MDEIVTQTDDALGQKSHMSHLFSRGGMVMEKPVREIEKIHRSRWRAYIDPVTW